MQFEGKLRFHLETEQTKLRLVMVKREFLTDIHEWRRLFFYFSDRADQDHKSLLQAYLLRCTDERHGCVLIVGFEHCLGDAATYAMFIAAWSDIYREQLQATPQLPPSTDIPPGVFSDDGVGERLSATSSDGHPAPRRFCLPAELLASLKDEMRRRSGEESLSVNDVLMAQVRLPPAEGSREALAQAHRTAPHATRHAHLAAACPGAGLTRTLPARPSPSQRERSAPRRGPCLPRPARPQPRLSSPLAALRPVGWPRLRGFRRGAD